MVDGPGRHVAVDCQLLAGHTIQRKSRANFCHPGRALGDHDEIHDQQHPEHHQAQEHASAHHEIREALNDIARSLGSGMPFSDDQLG